MESTSVANPSGTTIAATGVSGGGGGGRVFWRVEGSLLNLTAVRPVAFFSWNAQSFLGRWARRGGLAAMALARPLLYAANRIAATRILHTVLRGVSRDRLDLLGEEYFEYVLQPRLKPRGAKLLQECVARGEEVVLVSQALDHVMRPLAQHLGVRFLVANRLDFREGMATGRLLEPVIRPRGALARLVGGNPDGRVTREHLARDLGFPKHPERLEEAVQPAARPRAKISLPVVPLYPEQREGAAGAAGRGALRPLSVRAALRGKKILLIGGTGFIGKVWLANLLYDLPEIGQVQLLVRRSRSASALARLQRVLEESPVFEPLAQRYASAPGGLAAFLRERLEVVEGDVTAPGLGLAGEVRVRLQRDLDLVVNSSGLTDFNPDLRDALAANVRCVAHLIEFLRGCDHAALLHLSTCYVHGMRDGRVPEELRANYSPRQRKDFEAEAEWQALEQLVQETQARAESSEVTAELRREALAKQTAAKNLHGVALENQIRKNRIRWLRQTLSDAGTSRALALGWPNTYTLTKGLAESLLKKSIDAAPHVPVAIVRPSIVESSLEKPFCGWNEGVNTSAALSYLLGTYFRQLPTNERKCLDMVPVDQVTRGMTLIAAALVERRHAPLYQLATSATNPCDMRRSIELTGLGHRKFYRAQNSFKHQWKLRFDAIPVSKARYEKLSAPAQKAVVRAINKTFEPLPFVKQPLLARRERELEKVIKLIALFEPFILHNRYTFEAANIELLAAELVPEERGDFGYDTRSIDWWDFWINVHIPALRKWCYPLLEGRPVELAPRREVRLVSLQSAAAGASRASQTVPAGTA